MADPVENHPAVAVPQRAAASGGVTSTAPVLGTSSAAATALAPAAAAGAITGATPAAHQQRLVELYGSQMSNVTVKPWSAINWDAELEAFTDYFAWTNSDNEIYMRDLPSGIPDTVYYLMLYHEGLHILQFRREGGYPNSYEAMMDAEIEAYGISCIWMVGLLLMKSARWAAKASGIKRMARMVGIDPDSVTPPTTDYQIPTNWVTDILSQQFNSFTLLAKKKKELDKQKLTGTARENALASFMSTKKMLPQHTCIAELYGDPCPPSP